MTASNGNNAMKKFLLPICLWLLAWPAAVHATHIIGGEIGYKCLGNNKYEVTLSVYRDCFYGDPLAFFDDPAYVAVYDQFGLLVHSLSIPYMEDDTITSNLTDPCLVILQPVCVHTTTYRDTVTLPYRPGGYRLSYQRCCRNQTINNIVDPLATGATFDIHLTEAAMINCNTSPQFQQWPPIYICTNRPLVFDHSAVDLDGDSLVYKLCTPFEGGTLNNAQPQPADPPPYDTITWLAPNYSLQDMLGFGTPLTINASTGLMTAVPGITGQFVVGVCVEEYDAETGVLLSYTRRDFQYNVNPCGDITSVFFSPEAQCDNLTVTLENQSTNATGYQWYFDYPNLTPASTTLDPTVVFTYPDTGLYTVALIAEPNSQCSDTLIRQIFLQNNSLIPDFQASVFDCENQSLVQITDLSVDPVSPVVSWNWTLVYGNTTLTSTQQNPLFNVPLNVTGTITLTATSQNGCVSTFSKPFETGLDNPGALIRDTLYACIGETIGLNPDTPADIGFGYQWSPVTGLSNPLAVNPTLTVAQGAVYSVTITAPGNVCQIVKTVTVVAIDMPLLAFDFSPGCDGLTANFDNNSQHNGSYVWDFGDPNTTADTSLLVNPSYTYPDTGTYVITLMTAPGDFCRDTITQTITILEALLNAGFGISYDACSSDSVVVQFSDQSINNLNNTTGWLWELSNGQSSTEQNPVFVFYENTNIELTLTITTALNCTNSMTGPVDILLINNENQFPDTLVACPGDTTQLPAGGDPLLTYQWSPATGISDPASANPVFFPSETTLYTVVISAIGSDTCQFTETMLVIVPPAINLQVNTNVVTTCEPQVSLSATIEAPADIVWLNAQGDTVATGANFVAVVSGSQVYTVIATDALGCSDTETISVSGGPVDVSVEDLVAVCLGEEVQVEVVNNDPNDVLTYNWTPVGAFVPGTANQASPDVIETVGEQTLFVEVSNQFGCVYFDSVRVAVIDTAMALSFTYEIQCDGATVNFTNTSTNAFAYVWHFGDNTTSTDVNPVHTYAAAGLYTVLLTIAYDVNCSDLDSVYQTIIIAEPELVAAFDFDIVECYSDSAIVAFFDVSTNTFNNTIGWLWTFSNGQSSTEQNPVITVTESGDLIVTLTITSANDCTASVTDTVNIQLTQISLADTIVVCSGEGAPLNPNGNPSYQYVWTPADGLSDPNSPNPIASPAQTTIYTVTVLGFGADTCAVTGQVTVFVPDLINVNAGPDINTCGEDATLTITADVPAQYEWVTLDGALVGSGPSITVNPFRDETYIVIATDQYGCSDSDTVTVNDQGVDITFSPPGDTVGVCQNVETTIFVNNLDSLDNLTYQWSPADIIVGSTTGSSVTVLVDQGPVVLTAIVTNQNNCADTVSVTLNVITFTILLQDTLQACLGEPLPLNPDGIPLYEYLWSPGTGLSDSTAVNPLFIGDVSTTYSVTIIGDVSGSICETIREVTVLVNEPINLTVSPQDTSVCSLDPVTLTASSTVQDIEFEWFDNQNNSIGTGSTIEVTPVEGANSYYVVATDGVGCSDTASVSITATDFQPGLDSPVTACGNTPTPLNPNGNPDYVYTWDPQTGLDLTNPWNPVAVLTQSTTYNVTVTDPESGCTLSTEVEVQVPDLINLQTDGDTSLCEIVPVTLTATTDVATTIQWFDNPALTPPAIFTGNVFTTTPTEGVTTYYVLATEAATGCTDTNTIVVSVTVLTDGIPDPEVTACNGEPTPLNPNGNPNYVYTWDPVTGLDLTNPWNPIATLDASATYSVTITEPIAGCELVRTVQVNVPPAINIDAEADTTLCEAATITLTATTEAQGTTITWYADPTLTVGIGQGSELIITPQGAITYYAVGMDAFGCTDIDSVQVLAFPINATITPDIIFCVPTEATELVVTNLDPAQTLTYEWTPSPAILTPLDGPSVTVDPNDGNDFSVEVTNQYGCSATLSTTVIVIDIGGSLTAVAAEDSILLGNPTTITVTGCPNCELVWQVPSGALDPPGGDFVTVTPDEPGDNWYVVTATESICTATDSVLVFVINAICDENHLFLPNAFTPNGDGDNDILRLRSNFLDQLEVMELMIYSRWGEEMFRTNDPFEGWDGTYRGEKLPPDVFGFYLRVICPDGEEFVKKGNITLIR